MRGILSLLLAFVLFWASSSPTFAQEPDVEQDVQITEVRENADAQEDNDEPDVVTTTSTPTQPVTIYVSASCIHCKRVEEFVSRYNLGLYVNYISVDAQEGYDKLATEWERFQVSEQEMGWPFMTFEVDGEDQYLVGDTPINEYLSQVFNIDRTEEIEQRESATNSNSNLLMLLGGLFFFGIIAFSLSGLFKKNA